MRDFTDRYTADLLGDPPLARRGRPPKPDAKSAAQRMRDYRARLKAAASSDSLLSEHAQWCIRWLTSQDSGAVYVGKTNLEIIEIALTEAVRLRLVWPVGDMEPLYRQKPVKRKAGVKTLRSSNT